MKQLKGIRLCLLFKNRNDDLKVAGGCLLLSGCCGRMSQFQTTCTLSSTHKENLRNDQLPLIRANTLPASTLRQALIADFFFKIQGMLLPPISFLRRGFPTELVVFPPLSHIYWTIYTVVAAIH